MKAKNIISAILMVLSFAACTSEIEGIDDHMTNTNTTVNSKGETSLSVSMVANSIETKANGNELSEKAINNYIVAVFESVSGERIGYATGNAGGNAAFSKVENIRTKEGRAHVIVIANLGDEDQAAFASLYTYDDFTAKEVGSLDKLVKVGTTEVDFSLTNTATVELKQLTARVQVNMSTQIKGEGVQNVTADILATAYTTYIKETSKIVNPVAVGGLQKKVSLDNSSSFSYYTYTTNTEDMIVEAAINISNDGVPSKTINKEITVPFQENGISLKSLLGGNAYSIDIVANITVSVNCDVTFTYSLHKIEEIQQDEIVYE